MTPPPLLAAAHLGPTVAVTVVAGLLAVAADLPVATAVTLVAAVLAGQLTIGWSNDLLDAARDRQVRRPDKPLATGAVSGRSVRTALALAALAAVLLSLQLGWRSGLTHLVLVVGSGLAYNLGLKSSTASWLPYALAFGALPGVATLAADPPALPAWWMALAGALLGVGAHLVNALPDLADDAATGVRGLPHRLGGRASQLGATGLLVAASAVLVLGPADVPRLLAWLTAPVVLGLALTAAGGSGRTPFRAAIGIALVDVVLLTAVGQG